MKYEYEYQNGFWEGPWRQWTEDGRLSPDTLWRNGEE
jgi:antitoxin component YwqK of YwqJK toxin-antitoxin module